MANATTPGRWTENNSSVNLSGQTPSRAFPPSRRDRLAMAEIWRRESFPPCEREKIRMVRFRVNGDEDFVSKVFSPRPLALLFLLAVLAPLAVARYLSPSPDGIGTHQQLGLPPCSARLMFGVRCPACGMTTSWAHFTRGRFAESFSANPGGFGLAVLVCVCLPVFTRTVWLGRWPPSPWQPLVLAGLLSIFALSTVDWLIGLGST